MPPTSYTLVSRHRLDYVFCMNAEFHEPVRRKVGGSLSKLPLLERLKMLQRNALLLRGGKWKLPTDDGTLVRKTVGAPR